MDKKNFGTGALPPPGLEWQMGKTAASILFVREAENAMERAIDFFGMNYIDGDNMWGCGIGFAGGEEVIDAYVVDASKVDLPDEYGGFKVVIVEEDRSVPH